MTLPPHLQPLAGALSAVQRLLARFDNQGAVIGGVAVAFLGEPRATGDVDLVLLVSTEDAIDVANAAEAEALTSRVADPIAFVRRTRVMPLLHQPTGTPVDVSFGVLPFEREMIERAQLRRFGGIRLPMPSAEDLVILKAVAHRPKDLEDIRAIARIHQELDVARITSWVQQFADTLEMPELWDDIAPLLAR